MFLIILLSLCLLMSADAQSNPQQLNIYPFQYKWQLSIARKKHKNIYDYFMLIPSQWINSEGAGMSLYNTPEKRKNIITLLDSKNGYLQFYNHSQVVLFKDKKNQVDIIAVQSGRCGVGANLEPINAFYQLTDHQWVERTDLMPFSDRLDGQYNTDDICPYYNLPRYGKMVQVINEINQQVLAEYLWEKGKFIKIKN